MVVLFMILSRPTFGRHNPLLPTGSEPLPLCVGLAFIPYLRQLHVTSFPPPSLSQVMHAYGRGYGRGGGGEVEYQKSGGSNSGLRLKKQVIQGANFFFWLLEQSEAKRFKVCCLTYMLCMPLKKRLEKIPLCVLLLTCMHSIQVSRDNHKKGVTTKLIGFCFVFCIAVFTLLSPTLFSVVRLYPYPHPCVALPVGYRYVTLPYYHLPVCYQIYLKMIPLLPPYPYAAM